MDRIVPDYTAAVTPGPRSWRRLLAGALAAVAMLLVLLDVLLSMHWNGTAPLPIEVTVRDATTGQPVAGAAISIPGQPLGSSGQGTTDARGFVRVTGQFPAGGTRSFLTERRSIVAGEGLMSATAPGYSPAVIPLQHVTTRRVLVFRSDPTLRLEVRLVPTTASTAAQNAVQR